MIIIQDKLVSDDIISQKFVCNLEACKGACCWEGDFGAPLEASELAILDTQYEKIKPFLSDAGREAIEKNGKYYWVDEFDANGTMLVNNRECAYMTTDERGVAQCGIEKAYKAGMIDFQKPISCHLYPIRVTENPGFEALNYDEWSICSAACSNGERLSVAVYEFLKEPIIRKFGPDFYEELDAAAKYLNA